MLWVLYMYSHQFTLFKDTHKKNSFAFGKASKRAAPSATPQAWIPAWPRGLNYQPRCKKHKMTTFQFRKFQHLTTPNLGTEVPGSNPNAPLPFMAAKMRGGGGEASF